MIFFIYYILLYNLKPLIDMKYPTKHINLNLLDDSIDLKSQFNNYKKTVTRLKFLKEEKTMKMFNYNNINLDNRYILSINTILINNVTDFISYNIKPRNIKNETLYLLDRKTKVYIHIELLIPRTNIYHIGVTFKSITSILDMICAV